MVSDVIQMIQEQLSLEEGMLMTDDPFGTSAIFSLSYFNPQMVPTLPVKMFEQSFLKHEEEP